MDRKEWLEKRRQTITGTDIAAIAGMNPWRGPMDVYCDKLGLTEDTPDNPAMFWGRTLEDVVAQKYADDTGVKLIKGEFVVKDSWLGGTPDFLIDGQRKGLEIKTTGHHMASRFGESGSDQIPDHMACQVAWYQMLLGYDDWDLAVLIGGNDYRCFHLRRSPRLENRLLEIATKFREQHILTQTPPAIDGSRGANEYIKAVWKKENPEVPVVTASREIDELAVKLIAARQNAAILESEITTIENQIKAAIGEAPGIEGAGWRVSWKASKDSPKTSWKDVAAALNAPKDVIEKYTTVSPGARRFLLTVNKQ
jgi:putative phage-type endonuclease